MTPTRHVAIIGAGMAGITCARTLLQAGLRVTVFEQESCVGGRMSSTGSPFGNFDHGAQYFTVRDARFAQALQTTPQVCKPWSAITVQVLDALGRVVAAGLPTREPHWVPTPGMASLLELWAQPLDHRVTKASALELLTHVVAIERDALNASQWQLRTTGTADSSRVFSGFDDVVLAIPAPQALALLQSHKNTTALATRMASVSVAPCWTLLLAFPQAVQPGLTTLGPQWNAARSTHHRIAWLARESSKPGRVAVERWTIQASAAWSAEHAGDDASRVSAKLLKAFAEITGIRAEPAYVQAHRWNAAQTMEPLGESHLWDGKLSVGVCGDWCLGHRVENAFVSGLELALSMV